MTILSNILLFKPNDLIVEVHVQKEIPKQIHVENDIYEHIFSKPIITDQNNVPINNHENDILVNNH
jgi:hypothetical protein